MDLPQLTAKQRAFFEACQAGMSNRDAYKHAYDATNMTDNAISREAWVVRNNPKVAQWFKAANERSMLACIATKDAYTEELLKDRQECKDTGNYGAAIKALELAGKVNGYYVEKHQHEHGGQGLADVLRKIQTAQPALAVSLAASLGLDLPDVDSDSPTEH